MKAKARYVRIAPRKARLVADEVRGKSFPEAVSLLEFTNKRAAKIIAEVLESAAANAEHNDDADPDELFVRDIRVDDGPGHRSASWWARPETRRNRWARKYTPKASVSAYSAGATR
jgi:ribosomal protein L22